MEWWSKWKVSQDNQRRSNTFRGRGRLEELGAYLCPDEEPVRFVISGGVEPKDRYEPLYVFFDAFIGCFPMIILHNQDIHIEAMAKQAWEASGCCAQSPLWSIDRDNGGFEPFFGMSGQQVVAVIRQLAKKLGYTASPRLERVVRAHIELLTQLEIPVSLSGFHYLCQYEDMGEFYHSILDLPCGEAAGRRIWADLGIDGGDGGAQFELFRTIILNLAQEAAESGWSDENSVSNLNCLEAIRRGGTLLLPVNDLSADLLLPYLVEEWKANERTPFILLLDGVGIPNEQMLDYLCNPNSGCYCGMVAENAVNAVAGGGENFLRFAERMDAFILFKHATAKTADILAEVMGCYERTKVDSSRGVTWQLFQFLPKDRRKDIQLSTENRLRVMPEEIMCLGTGQAVVFDATADQIIYFN